MNILLVEDERDLAELTIDYLAEEGIECDYADNGQMALNLLENHLTQATQYDVLVLDVNIPKLDGFSLLAKLKAQGCQTPAIFVTARDALDDKLNGFNLGAEDYLTKPFEVEELIARLKVLKARQVKSADTFTLDDLNIDFTAKTAIRAGHNLQLSANQWLALALLAKASPNFVSRTMLEDAIWPNSEPSKDQLKMLLFRLRQLIDVKGLNELIQTQRGIGVALRLSDKTKT